MSDYVEGTDMKCPYCGRNLIPMDQRNYETLVEHATDPNGRPSLKVGYGCPSLECEAFGFRWIEDGEGPYSPRVSGPNTLDRIPREKWYPRGTVHYYIRSERLHTP